MSKHNLKIGNAYMTLEDGIFLVRHISVNDILITIFDTYGNTRKTSYLTVKDATLIDRETFDNLYKKHHAKQNIIITRSNYYYDRGQYKY